MFKKCVAQADRKHHGQIVRQTHRALLEAELAARDWREQCARLPSVTYSELGNLRRAMATAHRRKLAADSAARSALALW